MSFWSREPVLPPDPQIINRVIVLRGPEMSDDMIDKALAGNAGSSLYRAIVQLIVDSREHSLNYAYSGVPAEKPLVMAGGLKVHEVLSELLIILDKKVNATSSE
jgi:hypothetical protein